MNGRQFINAMQRTAAGCHLIASRAHFPGIRGAEARNLLIELNMEIARCTQFALLEDRAGRKLGPVALPLCSMSPRRKGR